MNKEIFSVFLLIYVYNYKQSPRYQDKSKMICFNKIFFFKKKKLKQHPFKNKNIKNQMNFLPSYNKVLHYHNLYI